MIPRRVITIYTPGENSAKSNPECVCACACACVRACVRACVYAGEIVNKL